MYLDIKWDEAALGVPICPLPTEHIPVFQGYEWDWRRINNPDMHYLCKTCGARGVRHA